MKPFVNPVEMDIPVCLQSSCSKTDRLDIDSSAFIAENLVTAAETDYILSFLEEVNWEPVSVTGMQGNYEPGDPIGSWRASSFQEKYAAELFQRISAFLPEVKRCDDTTNTDWDGHEEWIPVGVNPLLRFIKYTDGGHLIPHYDAPYVASDDERTLTSLVIYLDKDERITGGEVAFLHDPQSGIPVQDRNLEDWTAPAMDEDIKFMFSPNPGSGLVFDHRILHESRLVEGPGVKTIIRTDVMYAKG